MIEAIPADHDLVPISVAAKRLGISRQRARDLALHGALRARRVGDRLFVERSSVEDRLANPSPPGRRLSPSRAWGLLFIADGEAAPWLDAAARSKLRALLREQGLRALRPRLRGRGRRLAFRAHPSDLAALAAEPGLMLAGAVAAAAVGIDLLAAGLVDAYVAPERLRQLTNVYHFVESREPNLIMRELSPQVRLPQRPVAPRSAVALDLLDEHDPRSRAAAEDALRSYGP